MKLSDFITSEIGNKYGKLTVIYDTGKIISTVNAYFLKFYFRDWSSKKKTPPKIDGVVKLF